VNKRKSAISSCSSLERGKGFSFPFKVPRYARSLPAPIDTFNHCSKEPLASTIRGPYNQHKTTSLGPDAMLRDVIAQRLRDGRAVSSRNLPQDKQCT